MWDMVRLGDISLVKAGNPAPQDKALFTDGRHNFVRTSDVGAIKVGVLKSSADKLNNKGIEKLHLFTKDTILFPKSGASTLLNHRVILGIDAYVSSHLAAIKANNDKITDKYLWYFLQTIDAADLIADSAYPSLQIKQIESIEVRLPSLKEQQLIVAKLDAVFPEISKAIFLANMKMVEMEKLKISILTDELMGGVVYDKAKIGSVSKVIAGQSPKSENYNKEGRGMPFYQGKKDYGNRYLKSPSTWTTSVTKVAKKGDILMSVRAPVGALNIATQEVCVGRGLAVIRAGKSVDNNYMFYALLMAVNFLDGVTGAIFDSINKKQVEDIVIGLPSPAEQKRIAAKLDAVLAKVEEEEQVIKKTKANYQALKLSILRQELQQEKK